MTAIRNLLDQYHLTKDENAQWNILRDAVLFLKKPAADQVPAEDRRELFRCLGTHYKEGKGVRKNVDRAQYFFLEELREMNNPPHIAEKVFVEFGIAEEVEGSYEKAKEWYWRATKENTKNGIGHFHLGRLLKKQHLEEEAVEYLEIAAEKKHPDALVLCGKCNFALKRFNKALEYFCRLPESDLSNFLIGKVHYFRKNLKDSHAYLLKTNVDEAHYYLGKIALHYGDVNTALDHFSKYPSVESKACQGHILYKQGLVDDAIPLLEESLSQPASSFDLGEIYERSGNLDKSQFYYRIAASLDHNEAQKRLLRTELRWWPIRSFELMLQLFTLFN